MIGRGDTGEEMISEVMENKSVIEVLQKEVAQLKKKDNERKGEKETVHRGNIKVNSRKLDIETRLDRKDNENKKQRKQEKCEEIKKDGKEHKLKKK